MPITSLLALALVAAPPTNLHVDDPVTLLTRAEDRLGGDAALRAVRTVKLEYATHWMRLAFGPQTEAPSAGDELNTDWRDYEQGTWRNARRALGPRVIAFVDLVRDTVAARGTTAGWGPLNAAYLDERRELWLTAPERLLPRLRDLAAEGGVRQLRDTVFAARPHARLAATLDGTPLVLFLDRTSGLPAGVRFRGAQPFDFGLAGWGTMEVTIWWSRWTAVNGVGMPFVHDVRRLGRPYKRIVVQHAEVNVALDADSLQVSDSLRGRFVREQRRAMFDLPVDSARRLADGVVTFGVPGTPAGALRLRAGWLLVNTGAAGLSLERSVAALARADVVPVHGALLGSTSLFSAGGLPALSKTAHPLVASVEARPMLDVLRAQWTIPPTAVQTVTQGRWLRLADDSVYVEPLALPDAEGALLAWVPSKRWVLLGDASTAPQLRVALEAVARHGWPVAFAATARGVWRSLADVRRDAGLPPTP